MGYIRKKITSLLVISITLIMANSLFACDDTLVMLLTEKNPTSEFSKSVRNFMNSLTLLGTTLKFTPKEDYSTELNGVLNSWMEFSKKYMTNPPEEAKNDSEWINKMTSIAKKIGSIRKLINSKQTMEAHNSILDLSNTVGTLFENSIGITDKKLSFITTSADLNDLQRLISEKDYNEATKRLEKLKQDLETFQKYTTDNDLSVASNTAKIIDSISKALINNQTPEEIDTNVSELRTSFEELRSRILMKEWFNGSEAQEKGK